MENILFYGILFLTLIVITLIVLIIILSKKLRKLSAGKNMSSLEVIIIENNNLIKTTRQKQDNHNLEINRLKSELAKTIQNISVVRFNALGDSGGEQSFAIGLIDSQKNGVVISSMYTRGSMNVFAKEVKKGQSKHKLTDEEKQVININ